VKSIYLNKKKTIKPITGLGGVIGGQKFIVQNVLFKFAVGRPEMNVSNVVAAKIGGHELKSLTHLWECKIPDLCLPLQCLIDYLGFRMVAMLLLPINNSTLKVGSDDAGMSYHAASESLMKKFKRIGEVLNLAPHPLHGHTIYGPFDLEGHVGLDSKEYIIDFSRLFPPVPLHVNHPNGFLYRLFRPEFVKHYGNSLCSDGFTVVVAKHPKFNEDLVDAEKYLLEKCVPACSELLDRYCVVAIKKNMVIPGKYTFDICRTLHERGINARYMGIVYKHCKIAESRILLLIEMAARIIKQTLREKIRERMSDLKIPLETP
jgi:hypothetical protein